MEVIFIPLSEHPHNGVLHVTGVEGGLVMRPVTRVSNTHPPASPPDEPLDAPEEPPDEEPLDEELPDEELPDEEPLGDPLEPPDDPLDPPPSSELGLPPLLLLPQAVTTRPMAPAVRVAPRSATAPRIEDLMCRYRWRPGWAC